MYSLERISSLAEKAKEVTKDLGYQVQVKTGDGTLGWPEYAPYDRIIVTAASPSISPCWIEQLKVGGKIVVPVGGAFRQDLIVVDKITQDQVKQKLVCGCVFVPLIGKYGFKG